MDIDGAGADGLEGVEVSGLRRQVDQDPYQLTSATTLEAEHAVGQVLEPGQSVPVPRRAVDERRRTPLQTGQGPEQRCAGVWAPSDRVALEELEARVYTEGVPEGLAFDCSAEFFRNLSPDSILNMTTEAGDLDVTFCPSGTQGFPDLRRDALEVEAAERLHILEIK